MGEHYPYIKFLTDIIESGVWAHLSAAGKTLYLVLLKFSDQTFKPVWPSNEILLRLTGLKTKKSINEGKRDLVKAGLLQFVPGTGHKNTMYYFCFNYPGSKIPPQGVIFGNPRGVEAGASGVQDGSPEGVREVSPNNINITIHNTQNQKPDLRKEAQKLSLDFLSREYGPGILAEAMEIAKAQNQEGNLYYIRGICRNLSSAGKQPNFEHRTGASPQDRNFSRSYEASWQGFLDWCKDLLSPSSVAVLQNIRVEPDGRTLLVIDPVPVALRTIVTKYFTDTIHPSILVIFSAKQEENRTKA
ncbi:DNA-binding helix-turn-helix protein [Leptospira inadai serovar Lyme str. 10]|uniref:DNA-binding helix-turn-helix protein n=2 Tax=Leptospira inadai serovar Lyme TaxID=293084 RepID=V6HBF6_9LEPT|nr:helix-turn-helix domain-containing protein [Leptospira inadai]EQA35933.1 DNA-binding helix-turn-helix protein [Leptospira inadai serovar Lyme str. 10]PNV77011.1 helix-turn-helix domain-containing protein [Leptospira inadai serovar Lyme]